MTVKRISSAIGTCAMTVWLLFSWGGCAHFPRIIVTHDPLTSDEHIQLGAAYEGKREWDHAIDEYRKALKMDPRSMAVFYIGNAHCEKGEYTAGIDSYLRALELYPHHGDIYNNLAWAYLKVHRIDDGSRAIQKALALEPDNPAYLDTQKAVDDARRKLMSDPGKPFPIP